MSAAGFPVGSVCLSVIVGESTVSNDPISSGDSSELRGDAESAEEERRSVVADGESAPVSDDLDSLESDGGAVDPGDRDAQMMNADTHDADSESSGVASGLGDDEDEDVGGEALEELPEEEEPDPCWYILKVQVNREDSIKDALLRRVKLEGLERYFLDVVVPTEDVAEFTKTGKRRVVKRKLYPGYIMVNMIVTDDTWFLVRETPGIGDFTGSAGKPTPMDPRDVERILNLGRPEEEGETQVRTAIPFKVGDRVRVKEGYFQNFEGDVESIDEANGRVTVMINIFGRSTPVELEHWQIENV